MKKINNKKYDLYLYKTNKFKTIDMKLVFIGNVTGKDLIYKTVLFDYLTYCSMKYKTNRELLIECQNLYDIYIGSMITRSDNKLLSMIDLHILNPKYTNKSYFTKSINLLKECLFNPLVIDNHFDSKTLNILKEQIKNNILMNNNYPQEYVNECLYASLEDSNLSITLYQNINYLEEIDEYTLYNYYKYFLKNSIVKMFVCGDYEEYMIKDLLSFNIISNNLKLDDNKLVCKDSLKVNYLDNNFNQNKIACLLRYDNITREEYFYTSLIFNYIYGGLQDSLLMSNVRECNSLTYYIDSGIRRFDQVILVCAGFSKGNSKKVIKGIKDNLDLIINGEFDNNLIDKAQKIIINDLNSYERSSRSIINYMIGYVLFNKTSNRNKIKEILKINKKDIMEFSKKIKLSRIFVLKED